MKKITSKILLVCLVVALFPLKIFAADQPASEPIDKIVFFGDSLTDPGNLYFVDVGTLPKSPPYYKGRFSDGPTWAEVVSTHFDAKNIHSVNYAIGGETILYHDINKGYWPFLLDQSLTTYFVDTLGQNKSHTLYVLFIGANDYLWGSDDPEKDTTDVTDKLKEDIESLITSGGKNFVLLNLPDISVAPAAKGGDVQTLRQLSQLHNQKLTVILDELQKAHPDVSLKIFDYYSLINEILSKPDVYNKKFNTHITNLSDACWTGGYQLMPDKNREAKIAAALERIYKTDKIGLVKKAKIDYHTLAHAIATNPALSAAYQVGEDALAGTQPCADPSSYLFWDYVHPTSQGHAITGALVTDYIEKNFPL